MRRPRGISRLRGPRSHAQAPTRHSRILICLRWRDSHWPSGAPPRQRSCCPACTARRTRPRCPLFRMGCAGRCCSRRRVCSTGATPRPFPPHARHSPRCKRAPFAHISERSRRRRHCRSARRNGGAAWAWKGSVGPRAVRSRTEHPATPPRARKRSGPGVAQLPVRDIGTRRDLVCPRRAGHVNLRDEVRQLKPYAGRRT